MATRRGFLTGLSSLLAAPAIVRASSLMPVKVMPWDGVYYRIVPVWNQAYAEQFISAFDAKMAALRVSP